MPQTLFTKTNNSLENQLLLTALESLIHNQYILNSPLKTELLQLRKIFIEKGVEPLFFDDVDKVCLNSANIEYEKLIIIAKNIIFSIGLMANSGNTVSHAFNENILFEAYLSSMIYDEVKKINYKTKKDTYWKPSIQERRSASLTYNEKEGDYSPWYRPDMILTKGNQTIIIDFKNKEINEDKENKDGEPKEKWIPKSDLYQMIGYYTLENTPKKHNEVKQIILIYRGTGIDRTYQIKWNNNTLNLKVIQVKFEYKNKKENEEQLRNKITQMLKDCD